MIAGTYTLPYLLMFGAYSRSQKITGNVGVMNQRSALSAAIMRRHAVIVRLVEFLQMPKVLW